MSAPGGGSPDGLATLADYTTKQLEAEDRRKASFEQRGLAVITTSGALVTLLFGLAALSAKSQDFVLEDASKWFLAGALGMFVLAAIGALLTNVPVNYLWVEPDDIRAAVDVDTPPSATSALQDVAVTNIDVYEAANRQNQIKGIVLAVAMGLEVLAVLLVAVAIAIVIVGSSPGAGKGKRGGGKRAVPCRCAVGPKGDPGPPGPQGPRGRRGRRGPRGPADDD